MAVPNEDRFLIVRFTNPVTDDSVESTALINTGADVTCIPDMLAQILNLNPTSSVKINTPVGVIDNYKTIVNVQIEEKS